MSKRKPPVDPQYDVGYCKPPRKYQYIPGQSGNENRKKQPPAEHSAKMIERVINSSVVVKGQKMTLHELAFQTVLNRTITSGKMGDFAKLMEICDKSGVHARLDNNEEMRRNADEAWAKLQHQLQRAFNVDSADRAAGDRRDIEEAQIVIACPHCEPIMRARWKEPEYKALIKRGVRSHLHSTLIGYPDRETKLQISESVPRDKPLDD